MSADERVFLTYAEAAELARVPVRTLRWWVDEGRLRKFKPGRHPLVKRADVIALVESTEAPRHEVRQNAAVEMATGGGK